MRPEQQLGVGVAAVSTIRRARAPARWVRRLMRWAQLSRRDSFSVTRLSDGTVQQQAHGPHCPLSQSQSLFNLTRRGAGRSKSGLAGRLGSTFSHSPWCFVRNLHLVRKKSQLQNLVDPTPSPPSPLPSIAIPLQLVPPSRRGSYTHLEHVPERPPHVHARRERHLCVGQTGCGKSTSSPIPSVIACDRPRRIAASPAELN